MPALAGALLLLTELPPPTTSPITALVLDLSHWRGQRRQVQQLAARAGGPTGRPAVHIMLGATAASSLVKQLEVGSWPGVEAVAFRAGEPQDVRDLDVMLRKAELERGLEVGGIAMIPWLSSAPAVHRAHEIAAASTRVSGLCLEIDAYRADLSLGRSESGVELAFARGLVAQTARVTGAVPIEAGSATNGGAEFARDLRGAALFGFRTRYCYTAAEAELISALSTGPPLQ